MPCMLSTFSYEICLTFFTFKIVFSLFSSTKLRSIRSRSFLVYRSLPTNCPWCCFECWSMENHKAGSDVSLTHYCLTATIVTVLSKFRFQKRRDQKKFLWVGRRWEPILGYISKFNGIKVSGINGLTLYLLARLFGPVLPKFWF